MVLIRSRGTDEDAMTQPNVRFLRNLEAREGRIDKAAVPCGLSRAAVADRHERAAVTPGRAARPDGEALRAKSSPPGRYGPFSQRPATAAPVIGTTSS